MTIIRDSIEEIEGLLQQLKDVTDNLPQTTITDGDPNRLANQTADWVRAGVISTAIISAITTLDTFIDTLPS